MITKHHPNDAVAFASHRALVHAIVAMGEAGEIAGYSIVAYKAQQYAGYVACVQMPEGKEERDHTGAIVCPYLGSEIKGYALIVHEATGRTDPDELSAIEESMRQDVFQSTLDWQTRPQLHEAAVEAEVICAAIGSVKPDFNTMRDHHVASLAEAEGIASADVVSLAKAELAHRMAPRKARA